jgi:hypothetical protein
MDIEKLKALALAATPQNFDSAQIKREGGWSDCPACDSTGIVSLGKDYCNYDGTALGVQFYGIGDEHQKAEAYYRAANPAAVLELIAEVERLRADAGRYRKIRAKVAQDYLSFRKMDGERLDKIVDNVLDPVAAIEKEKA